MRGEERDLVFTTTPGMTADSAIASDGGTLPRTGGGVGNMIIASVALLLAGTAVVAASRRSSRKAAASDGRARRESLRAALERSLGRRHLDVTAF